MQANGLVILTNSEMAETKNIGWQISGGGDG